MGQIIGTEVTVKTVTTKQTFQFVFWEENIQISTKSWRNRGNIFTFVCVCVCLPVNTIPAERLHQFGRGFR